MTTVRTTPAAMVNGKDSSILDMFESPTLIDGRGPQRRHPHLADLVLSGKTIA